MSKEENMTTITTMSDVKKFVDSTFIELVTIKSVCCILLSFMEEKEYQDSNYFQTEKITIKTYITLLDLIKDKLNTEVNKLGNISFGEGLANE